MSVKNLFSPKIVITLVATYLVSAGISYAVVPSGSGPLVSPNAQIEEEAKRNAGFGQFANEPRTEVCPINGALFTKSEKNLWETKRPVLAMVENHPDSRPQSGLSYADIVYEAVAEGGIPRFMGVFYCGAQSDTAKIAPVRSARIYFVNLAAEYNTPVYLHVGGGNCSRDQASGECTSNKKAWAIEEMAKMGWRKAGGNDFDSTSDIGYPVLFRDYNRLGVDKILATEHTMVGSLQAAWKEAQKRGYTGKMTDDKTWISGFRAWKIDATAPQGIAATSIKFDFWKNTPDFTVEWKYDPATKTYLRNQGGVAHKDLENDKQLTASNVIVQFVKEEGPLDEHKHLFYYVIGDGTGILFRDGQAIDVKWRKAKQADRTIFTDKAGKEITLAAGTTWVEILPLGNKVDYN